MSNESSKSQIETQNEQENVLVQEPEPEPSKAWIFYSMSAGLCYGIGNTIYGISCSQMGFWGAGIIGPVPFCFLFGS